MNPRERELQTRHAQLLVELERERAALTTSLRELPGVPQIARAGVQGQLRQNWPALAVRLGQWLGAGAVARRTAGGLPALGWLPLVLGLLRWRRQRAARPTAAGGAHSSRAVVVTALVGVIAAALWRARQGQPAVKS